MRGKIAARFEPLFPSYRRNVAEAILTVGGFLHNWQVQGFHNIPKQGMSGSLCQLVGLPGQAYRSAGQAARSAR
jgi:hypothetical protein